MIYRKNLPGWERMLRVIAGVAMTVAGLLGYPAGNLGYGLAAMGLFVVATGFVGFCPACAMVGRKPR